MSRRLIYLDHAATTPLDPAVLAAMRPYFETEFANPSSVYAAARVTRQATEEARATIADLLGAKPTEIVFTSGGTESDNLAVQGILRAHPNAHWITTSIEHDAVLGCVEPLKRESHEATIVPVMPSGIIDVNSLEATITDQTVLISVMMANNEIGTIQPVAEVAKLVARVRAERAERGTSRPIYLHTDACQAAGYLSLNVSRLGVDLLTLNGSKMYGPKGVGLLYVRTGVQLAPLIYGGGQERGRRSGTENVAGIIGLAEAFKQSVVAREDETHRLARLRNELIDRLNETIEGLILNGDHYHRLANNVNFTIPGVEGEAMVLYLDKVGIMASTGSACSSGDLDPSHVLLAIGRTALEAESSLRLTLGRDTDQSAIDYVVEQLPPIVKRLRELNGYSTRQ